MDYRDTIVSSETTIHSVVATIDASAAKIATVLDADGVLLGTVTDGDIRRAILEHIPLTTAVSKIMNVNPLVGRLKDPPETILQTLRQSRLRHMPLLDAKGRLAGMEALSDILHMGTGDNCVVLMAGGEGQRLRPLTANTPKPLLSIGEKPILETIIDGFVAAGFSRFYISINYLGKKIREYFGDGSSRGIEITYLCETRKLGTAGALGLLPHGIESPFIVMNGDILTKVNYHQLMDYHLEHKAVATMCVREHATQVPFGVVEMDQHKLVSIKEKPLMKSFVNGGIYVLNPEILRDIKTGEPTTMPEVFENQIAKGKECALFPLREYWVDIGQPLDYVQANEEFANVFG